LGMLPREVEQNLQDHSERADKWGCVLLLDEADVFLARRDSQNVRRNALVTVFLRQLEYYSGILFITTNRPGLIDEAFKSRIHVSLLYPAIDLESTKAMFTNIMNRLERDNEEAVVKTVFERAALLKFAEEHYTQHEELGLTWNGRQIRNAFQTAVALGNHERQEKLRAAGLSFEQAAASGDKKWNTIKLTVHNFRNISETTQEFEDYIYALRGSDAQHALDTQMRYDDYEAYAPVSRGVSSSHYLGAGVQGKQAKNGPAKHKPAMVSRPTVSQQPEVEDGDEDDDSEYDSAYSVY
jgi:SpoVK/Ycf46/Vps4 family AAA+-type ATPase